jgi:hypothetical protein
MVYQKDKYLLKEIQSSGCYYLSLLYMCQIENKSVLSADDINKLYKYFVKEKFMDKHCTITNPDGIINYVLENKKIHQVGSSIQGRYTYCGFVKDKSFDWVLACYKTSGKYGTHWILMDKNYKEFYDPLLGDFDGMGIEKYILYKLY